MLLGELAAIASAATWAVTSLLLVEPARRAPSVGVSAIRLVGSLFFYLVLLVATGHAGDIAHLGGARLAGLLASAVLGFGLGDTLYIAGQHRAGVAIASPLSVTVFPVLTIALAWALLGTALSDRTLAGTVLTLAGVALILIRPGSATPEEAALEAAITPEPDAAGGVVAVVATVASKMTRRTINWHGVWLVIAATVAWAASSVWMQQLTRDENVIVVNAVRAPAVLAAVGGFAALHGDLPALRRLSRRDCLLVAGAGMFGTGIGSLAYVYALQQAGAGLAAVLNSLSPMLALPLAVLWLKERLTRLMIAGTALALIGVWLVVI